MARRQAHLAQVAGAHTTTAAAAAAASAYRLSDYGMPASYQPALPDAPATAGMPLPEASAAPGMDAAAACLVTPPISTPARMPPSFLRSALWTAPPPPSPGSAARAVRHLTSLAAGSSTLPFTSSHLAAYLDALPKSPSAPPLPPAPQPVPPTASLELATPQSIPPPNAPYRGT